MNSNRLTNGLLAVVAVLLMLNLLRPEVRPAVAARPAQDLQGIVRIDANRSLVVYNHEAILLGARRVFDQPFDNHTVEILARKLLED